MKKLKARKPGAWKPKKETPYAKGSDFSSDAIDYKTRCYACHRKFLIGIGLVNLHCDIFVCPHCHIENEVQQ